MKRSTTLFTHACMAASALALLPATAHAVDCSFNAASATQSVTFSFAWTDRFVSGNPIPPEFANDPDWIQDTTTQPFNAGHVVSGTGTGGCTIQGQFWIPQTVSQPANGGSPYEIVLTDAAGTQWGLDLTSFASLGGDPRRFTSGSQQVERSTTDVQGTIVYNGVTYNRSVHGYYVDGTATFQQVTAVPEPSTWAMLALGLVGVVAASRRRARA